MLSLKYSTILFLNTVLTCLAWQKFKLDEYKYAVNLICFQVSNETSIALLFCDKKSFIKIN